MLTTERFTNYRDASGNYGSIPTIAVEILGKIRHCDKCGDSLTYTPAKSALDFGIWAHDTEQADGHRADPRTMCPYCFCDDPEQVKYRQHPWYDAVECARCGGVHGNGIGD